MTEYMDIMQPHLDAAKASVGDKHPTMQFAWRVVHPDFTSSRNYRWPYPGQWAEAMLPPGLKFTALDPCPQFVGDGLCLAKNFAGAASGGIPAVTGLICGYLLEDMLGQDEQKIRVKRALVVEVVAIEHILKSAPSANLRSADLRLANLRSADLRSANLRSADLYLADLHSADLYLADLYLADLRSVDLSASLNLEFACSVGKARADQYTRLPGGWEVRNGLIVKVAR